MKENCTLVMEAITLTEKKILCIQVGGVLYYTS